MAGIAITGDYHTTRPLFCQRKTTRTRSPDPDPGLLSDVPAPATPVISLSPCFALPARLICLFRPVWLTSQALLNHKYTRRLREQPVATRLCHPYTAQLAAYGLRITRQLRTIQRFGGSRTGRQTPQAVVWYLFSIACQTTPKQTWRPEEKCLRAAGDTVISLPPFLHRPLVPQLFRQQHERRSLSFLRSRTAPWTGIPPGVLLYGISDRFSRQRLPGR